MGQFSSIFRYPFPATRSSTTELNESFNFQWPPLNPDGKYFGSHFIMGGEKFEIASPESFLFGENADLNYLYKKPINFPYCLLHKNQPYSMLNSLINVRKDSLRLVNVPAPCTEQVFKVNGPIYNLEFTFDAEVACSISIIYFATETCTNDGISYYSTNRILNSDIYYYKKGLNQLFTQSSHYIAPNSYPIEDWMLNPEKNILPIVIHCVAMNSDGLKMIPQHSHTTMASIDALNDNIHVIKTIRQRQEIDGVVYLLQEIYGIDNKSIASSSIGKSFSSSLTEFACDNPDEEFEDNGSECIVCMTEPRDTMILPCRHLCLCCACADSLRYQANNCPICRSPFRALLQIRAMRPMTKLNDGQIKYSSTSAITQETVLGDFGVPSGYEIVPLVIALSGENGDDRSGCSNVESSQRKSTSSSTIPSSSKSDKVPVRETSVKGKFNKSLEVEAPKSIDLVKATVNTSDQASDEDMNELNPLMPGNKNKPSTSEKKETLSEIAPKKL